MNTKIVVTEEVITFIKEHGTVAHAHGSDEMLILGFPKFYIIQDAEASIESKRLERGQVFKIFTEEDIKNSTSEFLKDLLTAKKEDEESFEYSRH